MYLLPQRNPLPRFPRERNDKDPVIRQNGAVAGSRHGDPRAISAASRAACAKISHAVGAGTRRFSYPQARHQRPRRPAYHPQKTALSSGDLEFLSVCTSTPAMHMDPPPYLEIFSFLSAIVFLRRDSAPFTAALANLFSHRQAPFSHVPLPNRNSSTL